MRIKNLRSSFWWILLKKFKSDLNNFYFPIHPEVYEEFVSIFGTILKFETEINLIEPEKYFKLSKINNDNLYLINNMNKSETYAAGFATIALEKYWMMWMQKWMMEKLGFHSINSITLNHNYYKKGHCFTAHLMWSPEIEHAKEPIWNVSQLLHGVDFCPNHPLYWGRYGCAKLGVRKIYEKCQQ